MRAMRIIGQRLRALFRRQSVESEMHREIELHLEQLAKESTAAGMSETQAHEAARRIFGNVELFEEECRDQRRLRWFEDLRADALYALRRARKDPSLFVLVTLVLGVGIGVNATVFSLIESVLVPNLPVHDQDRLGLIWSVNRQRGLDRTLMSRHEFAALREMSSSFDGMAANARTSLHLKTESDSLRLAGENVTPDFFGVLGAPPALGRGFRHEDALAYPPPVILSHRAWLEYFGADPAILRRSVDLNGKPHPVIGVTGADFWFLSRDVSVWMPMPEPGASGSREPRDLLVVGRLRAGVERSQAGAEVLRISKLLEPDSGLGEQGWEMSVTRVIPLRPAEIAGTVMMLWIVALILLIACSNIANILLAKSIGRRREIAIRQALGGSRRRILRQLIVESLMMALSGTAAGLALGSFALSVVKRQSPSPFIAAASVDLPVLLVCVFSGAACAVLFGFAPALQALRPSTADALKQGAATGFADVRGGRLSRTLLTGQVACATRLLLVSGLMVRATLRLHSETLGFRTEDVLTFRFEAPEYRYAHSSGAGAAHLGLLDALRLQPGFVSVGAGARVPTEGGRNNPTRRFRPANGMKLDKDSGSWAQDLVITPGYFEALDVPLLSGRAFNDTDTAGSAPVTIVNRALAERYFARQDAVTQRVELDAAGGRVDSVIVVGVVENVRNDNAGDPPVPMIYLPLSQHPVRSLTYVARVRGDFAAAAETVRAVVRKTHAGLPVHRLRGMRQVVREDLAGQDTLVGLIGAFGFVALLVAALGIYGVLSHMVAARRPEIGVRIALGSNPADVVRLFLGRGLRLTSIGLLLGSAGGVMCAWLFRAAFEEFSPFDPVTYATVLPLLLVIAIAACYLPARRASRVDPLAVLRCE